MSTRIGLGFGVFPFSDAQAFWRWIDYCDESEIDSVWLSERLVGAALQLEPLTALAAIGGRTKRLKFGMNATVLPLRDPLILAKECATIDYLSGGRLLPVFGVGGDVAPEFTAINQGTGGRGARSNEMLQLLTRLWSEDHVTHQGKYYQYNDVTISPKPKQSPLPVWIGGNSDAAIERTAKYGTGWLSGSAQNPAQIGRVVSAIRDRSAELGRPIDDDHYGAGVAFRFGSWDEPIVQRQAQQLQQRNPGVDPRAMMAVGGAEEVIEICQVLRAVGISKFVLRPIASTDDDMLEQSRRVAEEVIPTVHKIP
ncbi:MAG: LLM class flavin-dependent oxidoreductase [Dehalococcoidia bacterium]